MKVIWEPDDIKPGKRYSKPGIGEEWIIGYLSDAHPSNKTRYVSVSLSDGLVTEPLSKEDMARALTDQGYLPRGDIF